MIIFIIEDSDLVHLNSLNINMLNKYNIFNAFVFI